MIAARRCLILANPKAGTLSRWETVARWKERVAAWRGAEPRDRPATHRLPYSLDRLAEAAGQAGLTANVELMPLPDSLPQRLRAVCDEGYDTVVAVGGDGTVRTMAQALLRDDHCHRLALGILPLGTANNVAHSLDIPFDLEEAMRVLAEGNTQSIDVGRIGNEYFLEAAGVGLFADALQRFGAKEPYPYQIGRLLRVLGPLFWNLRARTLQLTLDDMAQQEEAIMVIVANGAYLGEGLALAPDATLTDGLFDVVIVGRSGTGELFGFARDVLRGTHLLRPDVRHTRARVVEIRRIHRSHRPLPVHADDHVAGFTPVSMRTVPGALRVIVPTIVPNIAPKKD